MKRNGQLLISDNYGVSILKPDLELNAILFV